MPTSAPGPTHDLTLLKGSGLLEALAPGVTVGADLASVGVAAAHPSGQGYTPRKKLRGQPRPPADIAYTTAFARARVPVEHTLGRRYQCLSHHRRLHTERVRAVAGLVKRALRARFPCGFSR